MTGPARLFVMQARGVAGGNATVPDGETRTLLLLQYAASAEAAQAEIQAVLAVTGWPNCEILRIAEALTLSGMPHLQGAIDHAQVHGAAVIAFEPE